MKKYIVSFTRQYTVTEKEIEQHGLGYLENQEDAVMEIAQNKFESDDSPACEDDFSIDTIMEE